MVFCMILTIFQFTTSQGGRRSPIVPQNITPATFNSRPHKEVDQVALAVAALRRYFQFTTSQGGRLPFRFHQIVRTSFNSRPHKEVDSTQMEFRSSCVIFQFTTSQGGRRNVLRKCFNGLFLSIHDLTRRSTKM